LPSSCREKSPTIGGSPLGDRIGPVQAQLPPAFGPDGLPVLLAFIRRLPKEWPWAIELRHPGWFDRSQAHRQLDELLIERGITRVVLDTRPLYAVDARSSAAIDEKRNKPDLPITLDAAGPHPIIRVIGEDSTEGTLTGLLAWVPQLVEWLHEGRDPYLFVHQPENLDSPDLARQVHAAVRQRLSSITVLPEPVEIEEPEQTSFW